MGRLHARLYRISGGRFLPQWFAGAPVMVLETVGRRSGHKRATPVLYLRAGDALIVLAANTGADRTPAWWLNLRGCRVRRGPHRPPSRAGATTGAGRRRT